MEIKTISCANADKLREAEDRLQVRGLRRVNRQSEKDLRHDEYYITQCAGTINDPLADEVSYTIHFLTNSNNP